MQKSNGPDKPRVTVELDENVPAVLPAQSCLSSLQIGLSYHEPRNRRHPSGIYSLSVGRICAKVEKCAVALEQCWQYSNRLTEFNQRPDLLEAVVDFLELSLYAAAEHVDDLETIATLFFKTDVEAHKSSAVRTLKRAIKPLRDRITSIANVIKHDHGRLRLYSVEVRHGGQNICLHGFFVEGFENGTVCPHPILHGDGETIISVTSFLWSILLYLGRLSAELETFLEAIKVVGEQKPGPIGAHPLRKAVIALARLPLYAFDEAHPFSSVRLVANGGPSVTPALTSHIYGSITWQWSKSSALEIGGTQLRYAGDGVSRSFRIVDPKRIQISYWD